MQARKDGACNRQNPSPQVEILAFPTKASDVTNKKSRNAADDGQCRNTVLNNRGSSFFVDMIIGVVAVVVIEKDVYVSQCFQVPSPWNIQECLLRKEKRGIEKKRKTPKLTR